MAGLNSLKSLSEMCVQMMAPGLLAEMQLNQREHLTLLSELKTPSIPGGGHKYQTPAAWEPEGKIHQCHGLLLLNPEGRDGSVSGRPLLHRDTS